MFSNVSNKPLFLLVLTLLVTVSAFAFQETSLELVITDRNGDVIPNATIRFKKDEKIINEFKKINSKKVEFGKFETGKYLLEIEAEGFNAYSKEINVKTGKNELKIILEVAQIIENVDVEINKQEKSLEKKDGAFTSVLTQDEIDALPDDPNELKRRLEEIAGPGAMIVVDGRSGGQIPPKSQIASIKIIRSSFDAEFHRGGSSYIEIITKATATKWNGGVSFTFNDEAFNARHSFTTFKPPSQLRSLNYNLNGPIKKGKLAFSMWGYTSSSFDTGNVVAILPTGQVNETAKRDRFYTYNNAKFSYNLTKNIPVNISFRNNWFNSKNGGVGGFSLPERAYDSKDQTNDLGVTTSSIVGKKYLHDFRFRFVDRFNKNDPLNDDVSIFVLDSFTGGGANNRSESRYRNFSVAETITWGVGKHSLKVGGLFEYESQDLESANNINGTFIFSNLNDFIQGSPSRFTQRLETRNIKLSQIQAGLFIQDDIRLHKTFMINLGLRYEVQNNLKDYNNFSPRIAFSWSPLKKGKLVFRGGVGIYYDWFAPSTLATILSNSLDQPSETIILNPGFPDPFTGGIAQPEVLANSFWQKADNLKNPYRILSSFGISSIIRKNYNLRATYSFERGVHQFRSRDINAPLNGVRPNLNFGRITQVESSAFFNRHALRVNFWGRFTKALTAWMDYTLSKRTSDADGVFSLPSDNYNLSLDRSVSNNDQRHRLFSSLNWRIKKVFQFSTNFYAYSGRPYTITTGADDNGDTIFNDRPFGIGRNTERGTWAFDVGSNFSWTYSFGKADKSKKGGGIIIITSDGAMPNADAKKKYSLQFYVSSSNLINRTNFTSFVGVQTSPFFGKPISSQPARRINFGMRFSF